MLVGWLDQSIPTHRTQPLSSIAHHTTGLPLARKLGQKARCCAAASSPRTGPAKKGGKRIVGDGCRVRVRDFPGCQKEAFWQRLRSNAICCALWPSRLYAYRGRCPEPAASCCPCCLLPAAYACHPLPTPPTCHFDCVQLPRG